MRVLRVYVDTSVIGGCFDAEFSPWSNRLFEDFRSKRFVLVVSSIVATEIESAPGAVREKFDEILGLDADILEMTDEVVALADAYTLHGAVPIKFRNDLLHIALATVANVDVLVSWNFKHMVRLEKIRIFNAVNLELGYKPLQIHSPREVASDE